jgi:hypothetical protein
VTCPKFTALLVVAIATPAFAQQAPDSASANTPPTAAAATAMASASTSNDADETAALIAKASAAANANARPVVPSAPIAINLPSAGARKKASEFGFHAEIINRKTMFCKEDAALGTRLKSKRCMSAYEFEDYSVQLKIARDLLRTKTQCQGGDICGGIN